MEQAKPRLVAAKAMTTLPRFMIAAAHKSSGKTMVSTGLARALQRSGDHVSTFKKGPDYIDPMWLTHAAGQPCFNLDFFTMEQEEISGLFSARAKSLSLVEANKGLYDGVQTDGSDSNAALAKLLGLPVILVIDTLGMTRGIAPLLKGYQAFDPDVNIAGIILNKVGGERHEGKLRQAIETYCDLPVLGSIRRNHALEIGERHLGLTTPAELANRCELISLFADTVESSVDLGAVRAIANAAPELTEQPRVAVTESPEHPRLRIGILKDAAFGFYYPDDLEAFEAAGASLIPIDSTSDTSLPEIDGLFIGGGFPECRMKELSANAAFRQDLRTRLADGLPCYAECGGLMYLCESLSWNEQSYPMVGLIPAAAVMHKRPRGRGYVAFQRGAEHPWGNGNDTTTAHEFHYSSIQGLSENTTFARKMQRGHGIDGHNDGIVVANTLAGFCHLRNTSRVPWVRDFLRFVESHSGK